MNLTICILTHKRPKLFYRCIQSVLKNINNKNIEIIVNNDSHDIQEVFSDKNNIKYIYNQGSLKYIYNSLIEEATNDFIYFLEDDDYILPQFFNKIDLNYDINFIEYKRDHKFISKYIKENSMKDFVLSNTRKKYPYLNEFIQKNSFIDFQLSQIVFNKKILNYKKIKKYIVDDNEIENDEILFLKCLDNCKINYVKEECYVQTSDGNDNISL